MITVVTGFERIKKLKLLINEKFHILIIIQIFFTIYSFIYIYIKLFYQIFFGKNSYKKLIFLFV